jgi:hypothetical protein
MDLGLCYSCLLSRDIVPLGLSSAALLQSFGCLYSLISRKSNIDQSSFSILRVNKSSISTSIESCFDCRNKRLHAQTLVCLVTALSGS